MVVQRKIVERFRGYFSAFSRKQLVLLAVLALLITGFFSVMILVSTGQDVRQQASGGVYDDICCTFNNTTYSYSSRTFCEGNSGQVVVLSQCESGSDGIGMGIPGGSAACGELIHNAQRCATNSAGSSVVQTCINGVISESICSPGYVCLANGEGFACQTSLIAVNRSCQQTGCQAGFHCDNNSNTCIADQEAQLNQSCNGGIQCASGLTCISTPYGKFCREQGTATSGVCGDNVCDSLETAASCPRDCDVTQTVAENAGSGGPTGATAAGCGTFQHGDTQCVDNRQYRCEQGDDGLRWFYDRPCTVYSFPIGADCSSTTECQSGLVCSAGKCKEVVNVGDDPAQRGYSVCREMLGSRYESSRNCAIGDIWSDALCQCVPSVIDTGNADASQIVSNPEAANALHQTDNFPIGWCAEYNKGNNTCIVSGAVQQVTCEANGGSFSTLSASDAENDCFLSRPGVEALQYCASLSIEGGIPRCGIERTSASICSGKGGTSRENWETAQGDCRSMLQNISAAGVGSSSEYCAFHDPTGLGCQASPLSITNGVVQAGRDNCVAKGGRVFSSQQLAVGYCETVNESEGGKCSLPVGTNGACTVVDGYHDLVSCVQDHGIYQPNDGSPVNVPELLGACQNRLNLTEIVFCAVTSADGSCGVMRDVTRLNCTELFGTAFASTFDGHQAAISFCSYDRSQAVLDQVSVPVAVDRTTAEQLEQSATTASVAQTVCNLPGVTILPFVRDYCQTVVANISEDIFLDQTSQQLPADPTVLDVIGGFVSNVFERVSDFFFGSTTSSYSGTCWGYTSIVDDGQRGFSERSGVQGYQISENECQGYVNQGRAFFTEEEAINGTILPPVTVTITTQEAQQPTQPASCRPGVDYTDPNLVLSGAEIDCLVDVGIVPADVSFVAYENLQSCANSGIAPTNSNTVFLDTNNPYVEITGEEDRCIFTSGHGYGAYDVSGNCSLAIPSYSGDQVYCFLPNCGGVRVCDTSSAMSCQKSENQVCTRP